MPRVRRRSKRKRVGYNEVHIDQLLTGHDFLGKGFGRELRGTQDVDAMRTAWELLRNDLLLQWVSEQPGTRPYAWWMFDAPERRRRVGTMRPIETGPTTGVQRSEQEYEFVDDDRPHPFDNPDRIVKVDEWRRQYPQIADRQAHELWFGKPACMIVPDDFVAVYETEPEYLARLGLLEEDEY